MKPFLLMLGALSCGIAIPAVSQDQDRRFHLGLDVGQGSINRKNSAYTVAPGGDRTSTGWKLRFGWTLSPHWSFEAAYTDFGDYEGSRPMLAIPGAADEPITLAQGDLTTSARGFEVSAIGTWPIGEYFYMHASAGLLRRELRTVIESYLPPSPPFRANDGDLAVQYGIGVGFRLNESWDVGLNWTATSRIEGDSEFLENQADPTMVSVGARYRL